MGMASTSTRTGTAMPDVIEALRLLEIELGIDILEEIATANYLDNLELNSYTRIKPCRWPRVRDIVDLPWWPSNHERHAERAARLAARRHAARPQRVNAAPSFVQIRRAKRRQFLQRLRQA